MATTLLLAALGEGASGLIISDKFPSGCIDSWWGRGDEDICLNGCDASDCVHDDFACGWRSVRGVRFAILAGFFLDWSIFQDRYGEWNQIDTSNSSQTLTNIDS